MNFKKEKSGFTLIELIMVIVILGILAVVAIPKFVNMTTQANQGAEAGVVGAVRAGIQTWMANDTPDHGWPTASDLDSHASDGSTCTVAAPCFDGILEQGGVTDGVWKKDIAGTYTGPAGTVYTYTPATGAFKP